MTESWRAELEAVLRPLELHAWSDVDGRDRLEVVEEGIRDLIRDLAAARGEVAENEARSRHETEKLLLSILDVLDAFERVLANVEAKSEELTPQMTIWTSNFRTVYKLLANVLREHGVSRLESESAEFDPERHRAAEAVVDPTRAEGTIVRELQRGYVWNGRLLRKAEVVVAAADASRDGSSG